MPISPIHLIDLAKTLSNTYNNEVEHRAGASRAYYSIFHTACVIISKSPPKKNAHQWVIGELKEISSSDPHVVLASKAIANIMEHCRKIRIRADYEIRNNFSELVAQQAVDFAKKVQQLYLQIP